MAFPAARPAYVSFASNPVLTASEGVLLSVIIPVYPRELESVLEALANADFPLNPQIYHDGALVFVHQDGSAETEPATLVEFPAYAGQLARLRRSLESFDLFDFHSSQAIVTGMPGESDAELLMDSPVHGATRCVRVLRHQGVSVSRTQP